MSFLLEHAISSKVDDASKSLGLKDDEEVEESKEKRDQRLRELRRQEREEEEARSRRAKERHEQNKGKSDAIRAKYGLSEPEKKSNNKSGQSKYQTGERSALLSSARPPPKQEKGCCDSCLIM